LDRFAAHLPGAAGATAFCAVLSPKTGELVYSSAGHPPPILVQADSTVRLLDEAGSIPLGLRIQRTRHDALDSLPPRATLLLYTDGLVERRREPLDQGIERAAALVGQNRGTELDELADRIMAGLAPSRGYQDDVALLLYRQPGPLDLEIGADASNLAMTRAALRNWLNCAGANPDDTLSVLIAVGEALSNAIEHGHRHSPDGVVTLRASALADRLLVTVGDTGSWKDHVPDATSHRGRGISMMRALMQEVTIQRRATGTTVHMQARIA
jgi:anti-sigma regulatory factor (Ser/Thr protein kinase)